MNRLTTDNPQNNFETMMNLVYAKDGWQHIRHGDTDMKTTDFCLELCKARECEPFEKCETDEEKDECLCSCLFDGCPIATVYAALCGYGHTRNRLKMYEDMGMKPKWISVKERKPEDGQKIIATFRDNGGRVVDQARYNNGEFDFASWTYVWGDNVTHWMPLPQPPEED